MARDPNALYGFRKIAASGSSTAGEVFTWVKAAGGSITVTLTNSDGGDSPVTVTLSDGDGIPGTFTAVSSGAGSTGDALCFLDVAV